MNNYIDVICMHYIATGNQNFQIHTHTQLKYFSMMLLANTSRYVYTNLQQHQDMY